jgi:replicative DNA helicase
MARRENEDFLAVAEFQVLNLLCKSPDLVTKEISSESFPHKKARSVYKAIHTLLDAKEEINEGSLLREANAIDSSVDQVMIRGILNYKTSPSNLDKAIVMLQEGSVKYRVGRSLAKIKERIESPDTLNSTAISALLYEAQESLALAHSRYNVKTLEECLDDYYAELELRRLGHHHPFNDPFLDQLLTKKAAPGQVVLIAGATGTGKSAYGLNLITHMIDADIPCMYFSLEMDTVSTMDRFMAMRTEIPVAEWYRSGAEIDPLMRRVLETKAEVIDRKYSFIDDPSISLDAIQHLIREFKITHKVDYACVYIDLITQVREFIDMNSSKGSLATTIELAVNRLNAIAKRENVCIVAIAQMNRGADSTHIDSIDELSRLRPTLNHVKNSGALGERSRVVLSVFRPKYYATRLFPDHEDLEFMPDELEVQVLKQSMGAVGTIGRYNFNGPTFTCRPLSNEEGELDVSEGT